MPRFEAPTLRKLAAVEEVEIETQANAASPVHRTIIWVVAIGDEVYVRSFHGATARWYREIRANPVGALYAEGQRIAARAVPATDAATVAKVSDAYRQKYAQSPALPSMVRDDILATTLRLEPRS